jgi:hypothetical protein
MGITVRLRRHLDSETLHVPEIRPLLGRDVEIEVRDVEGVDPEDRRQALRGSVLRMDDPLLPLAEDDWEANG